MSNLENVFFSLCTRWPSIHVASVRGSGGGFFPRLREFGENVRPFTPRLRLPPPKKKKRSPTHKPQAFSFFFFFLFSSSSSGVLLTCGWNKCHTPGFH